MGVTATAWAMRPAASANKRPSCDPSLAASSPSACRNTRAMRAKKSLWERLSRPRKTPCRMVSTWAFVRPRSSEFSALCTSMMVHRPSPSLSNRMTASFIARSWVIR